MRPDEVDDWEEFLEDQGCENITDYGDWIMCVCPFHEQSHTERPSFGIYKETGTGNCFGCGGHTWPDICERFGLSSLDFIDGIREASWQKFKAKVLGGDKKKVTYKRYHLPNKLRNPLGHRGAREYLIERNGYDTELLSAYGIRLCMDKSSKYYEHIIFPIEDEKGILFFDARYAGKLDKTRWRRPSGAAYWKTYFNWINVSQSKNLLFVEGASSALKFIQFGWPTIPAKNFSDRQLKMIRNSPVERIFLFYDNDEAGRSLLSSKGKPIHFTAKAQHLLEGCGIEVIVGILPDYANDPADVKYSSDVFDLNFKLAEIFV